MARPNRGRLKSFVAITVMAADCKVSDLDLFDGASQRLCRRLKDGVRSRARQVGQSAGLIVIPKGENSPLNENLQGVGGRDQSWIALDPDIILGCALAANVSRIQNAAWLDEHQFDGLLCIGLVLDPFRHNKHFAFRQMNPPVAEVDAQFPFDDNEGLVGFGVFVPYKITLQFHDFELVVVHLGNDLWRPLLVKQRQLLFEIYRFVFHRILFLCANGFWFIVLNGLTKEFTCWLR